MEFDSHLSLVQGCLSHAKRTIGPLDNLSLDENFDAVQDVVKKVGACIDRFSEKEVQQSYLFLLLNCIPAVDEDDLQESELSHLLGIAPLISVDVFLALSVEVFGTQSLFYEAVSVLPLSLSFELCSSFVSHYVERDMRKIADKLDILCLALYQNVLTSMCEKNCQQFLTLLETVLNCIVAEEDKADSSTYFSLLKAALSLLKSCFNNVSLFDFQMWKDFYARPAVSNDCVDNNRDKAKRIIVKHVSEICSNIPKRSMLETCNEQSTMIRSIRELAYECIAELRNFPSKYDNLLNVLVDIAQKPYCVLDEIKDCSLPSLCSNAKIKNEHQLLWLKALIRHDDALTNPEALTILHELVDLFDPDDLDTVCALFFHFPDSTNESFRDLTLKCFSRLNREWKLEVLSDKIRRCADEDIFLDENCESQIVEVLNRLVAKGESDTEQEDQLLILAFKQPDLVVKHTLLTAASNKLFSESVVEKVLKTLQSAFTCPSESSHRGTNLTELNLSQFIFNTDEINGDLEGLQTLVKVLLKSNCINPEYFVHSCIFPPLFNAAHKRQEQTVILLLHILLDFQIQIPLNKNNVSIATVLVFLGQLLEWFTHAANLAEESEGNIIRDITVRNIVRILSVPGCVESIQGKDKEWIMDELSVLSPENRHYFSPLVPEWMLFHGKSGGQVVIILATFLPFLHVTEWHAIVNIVPRANEEDNLESVLTLCTAVNLIARSAANRESLIFRLNLKSCVCNLGSVIQSVVQNDVKPRQIPRILQELLALLEYFPKSEQFEVAIFLLPIMVELLDIGSHDGAILTALGTLLLNSSVQCVRRDLGRHFKRLSLNCVNGNGVECKGE